MDEIFFHPRVVHVPIALAVLMPLLAGGTLLAWRLSWLPRRAWILVVGLQTVLVVAGVIALRTGEAEEERVERVVSEARIEAHEEAAQAFVAASSASLVLLTLPLLLGERRSRLAWRLAGLGSLSTLLVFGLGYRAGHAGGELVYRYGAASAYTQTIEQGLAETAPRARVHEDDD